MVELSNEHADVGMVDRVYRRRQFHNDEDASIETHQRQDEIPEEIMEQLDPYVGDGNAHLTVSGSLSSSHEYHKAESFVSVSVTCNNNLDDIQAAHKIVRPFVHELVLEDHNAMSLLRDEILPSDKRLHGNEPKGPAIVAGTKVATPPQRSASVITRPGAPVKPTFKR